MERCKNRVTWFKAINQENDCHCAWASVGTQRGLGRFLAHLDGERQKAPIIYLGCPFVFN